MERRRAEAGSGRNSAIIAIAAAPIGRFIQNTSGQAPYCTIKAPSEGPITAETPKTPDSMPWTRARSTGL